MIQVFYVLVSDHMLCIQFYLFRTQPDTEKIEHIV